MITTKGVEVECRNTHCKKGKVYDPVADEMYRCECTGQKTIPIPVEYQEEVFVLLDIEEPHKCDCRGEIGMKYPPECSMRCEHDVLYCAKHKRAKARLSKIEQLIIKNSKG